MVAVLPEIRAFLSIKKPRNLQKSGHKERRTYAEQYLREPMEVQTTGGLKNGSNFNETITRSRCTLWTPNKKMGS